jgi:hypothetical protein
MAACRPLLPVQGRRGSTASCCRTAALAAAVPPAVQAGRAGGRVSCGAAGGRAHPPSSSSATTMPATPPSSATRTATGVQCRRAAQASSRPLYTMRLRLWLPTNTLWWQGSWRRLPGRELPVTLLPGATGDPWALAEVPGCATELPPVCLQAPASRIERQCCTPAWMPHRQCASATAAARPPECPTGNAPPPQPHQRCAHLKDPLVRGVGDPDAAWPAGRGSG